MQFIDLIKRETSGIRRDIVIAAGISGLSVTGLLAVINSASQAVADENLHFGFLLMFLVMLAVYAFGFKYTFDRSNEFFEAMIDRIRVRLSGKIRSAELTTVEAIGRETIYSRITQETDVISYAQKIIVEAIQSAVMVLFTSVYIFTMSPVSFVLIVGLFGLTIAIYTYKDKETNIYIRMATDKGVQLLRLITHLLSGFKQIKVRGSLGDSLLLDIEKVSGELRDYKIRSARHFNANTIFAQSLIYLVLGSVVFVLPRLIETHHTIIAELTASVLFLIGPLSTVVGAVPTLEKANVASAHLESLENELDVMNRETGIHVAPSEDLAFSDFAQIRLKSLLFDFNGEKESSFCLGPLDLTIHRGERLFIIGGNGSGKTTLLRLLTGLYQPAQGHLEVDGERITRHNLQSYRELFSVIFGDFYLFEKLYGLDHISRETVLAHLVDMELEKRTQYDGEYFSDINLSTGQRKRLALLVALLEDRPIFIFDEWAADQDPQFRKHFYENIMPGLSARGKTILAVTHDDHYFHFADRVLKLDYGKIEYTQTPDSS